MNSIAAGYELEQSTDETNIFEGLSREAIRDLHDIHACVFELMKHFWSCFPPINQELEDKVNLYFTSMYNFS